MPARKPQGLKVRHDTKAEIDARVDREASMAPAHELPMAAPARLRGHPLAAESWRRLMRGWAEIEAQVVTRLDMDLLIDYCILMEQCAELDRMRKVTYGLWLEMGAASERLKHLITETETEARQQKDDPEKVAAAAARIEHLEEQAINAAAKCIDAFEAVVKLDGRVDRKRALLLQWRQSLYLTPRARAGAAPTKKEQEVEVDPLEALLNNVNDFVNGDGKP